jgi:hypothetical protein
MATHQKPRLGISFLRIKKYQKISKIIKNYQKYQSVSKRFLVLSKTNKKLSNENIILKC